MGNVRWTSTKNLKGDIRLLLSPRCYCGYIDTNLEAPICLLKEGDGLLILFLLPEVEAHKYNLAVPAQRHSSPAKSGFHGMIIAHI
ncbi:hypothetical protein RSOLAG1IB_00079 [Rhizoctonia solani AG-1 IB]|uniref:Uncharacterized protein n=1 Tax=Thanatephorus cucumeris (strain AG1-IB / isolate 7/3/14) TaxID=1108050 RepID=A0A0B7F3M1_THACB|nr:hypothetical protein RSOLAG1IB_00079 [Rhizoctonia solani AG-1 IB]